MENTPAAIQDLQLILTVIGLTVLTLLATHQGREADYWRRRARAAETIADLAVEAWIHGGGIHVDTRTLLERIGAVDVLRNLQPDGTWQHSITSREPVVQAATPVPDAFKKAFEEEAK